MKIKVGKWNVSIQEIEDWRDEKGYVLIRGVVQEDGAQVEFYAYPDEGYASAYEINPRGPDFDWDLSEEEEKAILDFVSRYLSSSE